MSEPVRPVRHIAGPYKDGVQQCTRCLKIIVDNRGALGLEGSEPAPGFAEGSLCNYGPSWYLEAGHDPSEAVDCEPCLEQKTEMDVEIEIDVTAEFIENGSRVCPCFCPIGLAFRAATGRKCSLSPKYLHEFTDDEIAEHDLPSEAQIFIGRYDHGKKVEPFKFKMMVRAA